MSYQNMVMYSSVLPSYDDLRDEKESNHFSEALDANNPDNFKNEPDLIVVRK